MKIIIILSVVVLVLFGCNSEKRFARKVDKYCKGSEIHHDTTVITRTDTIIKYTVQSDTVVIDLDSLGMWGDWSFSTDKTDIKKDKGKITIVRKQVPVYIAVNRFFFSKVTADKDSKVIEKKVPFIPIIKVIMYLVIGIVVGWFLRWLYNFFKAT
jgi:hypothetical protein